MKRVIKATALVVTTAILTTGIAIAALYTLVELEEQENKMHCYLM